ncbi:hypothetical protein EKG37_14235 [Robertmurraya yapensis]|uniref:Uncharacterized protein n=1 Tax=Bacillus yapensis TaxID=2492960 RepID=A0A431W3M3_9BACI|nr:hypothetical protein [Bacillus yapensis]RTR30051.1 hypothetical protein EKG37_14235 [Bacillus yapensis]TKS95132.1 hypothetical protein FAR12_14235 [Bacillus yapensis]
MGYIAPIPNFQYSQYAERELDNGYDPFQIIPVGRTKPATNAKLNHAREQDMVQMKQIKKKSSDLPKTSSRSKVEELYSELTGKGRYINECI